jgi:hypothetical protein
MFSYTLTIYHEDHLFLLPAVKTHQKKHFPITPLVHA